MSSNDLFKEFKKGISEASKYVLSHHLPEDYYKCYSLRFKNKRIYFCSRCLGVYIGICLGLTIFLLGLGGRIDYYFLVTSLPLFALFDWTLTNKRIYRSNNLIRSTSGICLGIAYSLGLMLLITSFPDYYVLLVGLLYMVVCLIITALS